MVYEGMAKIIIEATKPNLSRDTLLGIAINGVCIAGVGIGILIGGAANGHLAIVGIVMMVIGAVAAILAAYNM